MICPLQRKYKIKFSAFFSLLKEGGGGGERRSSKPVESVVFLSSSLHKEDYITRLNATVCQSPGLI